MTGIHARLEFSRTWRTAAMTPSSPGVDRVLLGGARGIVTAPPTRRYFACLVPLSGRRPSTVDGSLPARKRTSNSGHTRSACVAATAPESSARTIAAVAAAGNGRSTAITAGNSTPKPTSKPDCELIWELAWDSGIGSPLEWDWILGFDSGISLRVSYVRGRVKTIVVPAPGRLTALMSPPCPVTIPFAMASPRPEPRDAAPL